MLCATMANLQPREKPLLRPFEPGDFFSSVPIKYEFPEEQVLAGKIMAAFGIADPGADPLKAR